MRLFSYFEKQFIYSGNLLLDKLMLFISSAALTDVLMDAAEVIGGIAALKILFLKLVEVQLHACQTFSYFLYGLSL
jgi:hypothetical protein